MWNVGNLLAAYIYSQSLFDLLCEQYDNMDCRTTPLHEVFQAIVVNKLTHVSPAWWRFASADDRNRLEAFLYESVQNWVTGLSSRDNFRLYLWWRRFQTVHSLVLPATLNTCCIRSSPWTRASLYSQSLRQRSHNFQLPDCRPTGGLGGTTGSALDSRSEGRWFDSH